MACFETPKYSASSIPVAPLGRMRLNIKPCAGLISSNPNSLNLSCSSVISVLNDNDKSEVRSNSLNV